MIVSSLTVMVFEDRLTIETPEGIALELTLAGVGSRFAAALVDYLIQALIVAALAIFLYAVGLDPFSDGFAAAVWTVAVFVVFMGYDIAFEVLNSGRTPGKALNGLRVVLETGAPVTFPTSAVRNVLRIIDILPPPTYLVGISAILVTRRNQRVGDLAAGTLVVRERRPMPPEVRISPSVQAPAWDTTAISVDEVDAVVAFLGRRSDLPAGARLQLAAELARRLRPKVAGTAATDGDEMFLERLVAAKRGRG
jgi:uncharacterized RDD family membrane protein YckC